MTADSPAGTASETQAETTLTITPAGDDRARSRGLTHGLADLDTHK
jgi:hypothetical protein